MKLPIQTWLDGSDAPEPARTAFEESFTAYRSGAYRAAFLFSYLGWMLVLRMRFVRSRPPGTFPPADWTSVQTRLSDDLQWEEATFQCIEMKNSPKKVLDIPDELRRHMHFWRDRRNDCAHFKLNVVGESHVDAFWQFITSNASRFATIGSESEIIKRFKEHFDLALTPPGTPIDPIVALIPGAMEAHKFKEFLATLEQACWPFGVGGMGSVELYEAVIRSQNGALRQSVIDYLASNEDALVAYLRQRPSRCSYFADHPVLIRKLWFELLFGGWSDDLPVFEQLLRHQLVPQPQIAEAVRRVAARCRTASPTPATLEILKPLGFLEAVEESIVQNLQANSWNWGNEHRNMIVWMVGARPVSRPLARAIVMGMAGETFPWHFRDALRDFLVQNPAKRTELESATTAEGLTLPAKLDSHER